MSETIRSFIAFKLSEKVIKSIGKIQRGLKDYHWKLRWVNAENIHLTMKFLGDIELTDIRVIDLAIQKSVNEIKPFSMQIKGIGIFPGINKPRVIWTGLSGDSEQLHKLQQNLEEELESLGFPKEKRHFRAHLTLGRVKARIKKESLIEAVNKFSNFKTDFFQFDRLILFKSKLKKTGALYTPLKEYKL
ncbi:RNA 2',3'-cyclic phosphodiesterase [Candidatus Magnetomoraceae bacterium gMMP-1]